MFLDVGFFVMYVVFLFSFKLDFDMGVRLGDFFFCLVVINLFLWVEGNIFFV